MSMKLNDEVSMKNNTPSVCIIYIIQISHITNKKKYLESNFIRQWKYLGYT